jgi:molybdate transport system regulatory protein
LSYFFKKDSVVFINPLKTELMNEIRKNGSLSDAAKNMKISYQHVWTMIDQMNRMTPYPLVLKQRGGTNGGGNSISDYGERMLREYQIIQDEIRKVIAQINVEINL